MKQRESFMKNIQSELSLTTTVTTARMVRICLRWAKWTTINYIVVSHGDDKDELYQTHAENRGQLRLSAGVSLRDRRKIKYGFKIF